MSTLDDLYTVDYVWLYAVECYARFAYSSAEIHGHARF